ncbi:putative nucleic acid-binding protein [Medicago truncatula]|uniref:Putative nucleic acid-binding protein n=2 Tax=Medicago truncatula TaxID=3880 RepID=A0A396HTG3_MEDTR|nr:putative nucleic acid-binding protein [Medicago truncatula]
MSQNASQFSQGSQLSTPTDIMSKATFLSLSEINDITNEIICVTVAEITKLNATRYGWTYDGCKECTKVVKMDDGQLKCKNAHVNQKPVPRYKVEVQVEHKGSKARFLFWDELTVSILGISATDLREQMIQAGHTNSKTYPKLLDKLVFKKKKVFKVKAHPGSNPCSIIQFSESEQLLGNLEKQFGLEEESQIKNVAGEAVLALEAVSETKDLSLIPSLSLCGENEPSFAMSTPPAKRLSQDESDSATKPGAEDIQPTQLSSTKFANNRKYPKTPKLEKK